MEKKELKSLINRLEYYNRWRRDDDDCPQQLDPKQLGKDIDTTIAILSEMLSKLYW